MKIKMRDVVGRACVDFEAGTGVYETILPKLSAGEDVSLDFTDVDVFASPFFNAALAPLVKDFTSEELNSRLHFKELNSAGRQVARRSIENAKEFYNDPEARKRLDDILRQELRQELD